MLRPTLFAHHGVHLFTFNGMEGDEEVKGNGNSLDFGARVYDNRLGKWLALDPLSNKYPAISPYAFGLNSPLLFMDPNGKEGVVTIQRNPEGGGTIIISTIVYVTGAGVSKPLVDMFNQEYKQFANPGTYTHEGEEFDVVVNIVFEFAPKQSAIKRENGENIMIIHNKPIRAKANGTGTQTTITTDMVTENGTTTIIEIKNELGYIAELGSDDDTRDAVHEVFHLLGLSERYTDVPLLHKGKIETQSKPHEGFENDIMAVGSEFSQIHTDNYGKYILGQERPEGDTFILDEFVDFDNSTGKTLNGKEND